MNGEKTNKKTYSPWERLGKEVAEEIRRHKQMKTHEEIAIEAIAKFGPDNRLTAAIKEMAELTKEICKYKRDSDDYTFLGETQKITEEMADVYIALFHMQFIFHNAVDVQAVTEKKMRRLAHRLYKLDMLAGLDAKDQAGQTAEHTAHGTNGEMIMRVGGETE